jgi:hypothetical protein
MRALLAILALLVVLGLGFLLYSSPTTPSEMTEAEVAQIEAEVTQVLEDFLQANEEMDCGKVAALYHPEHAGVAWGSRLLDASMFQEACESFFDGKDSWTGYWVETNVRVLTRDFAEYTGRMGDTIHYSDGRVREWPGNCVNIGVMERTPDGWKATIGAQTCGSSQLIEEG